GKEYYVPNGGKDPESVNPRYRIRGNGVWQFRPRITLALFPEVVHDSRNAVATSEEIIRPVRAGWTSEVTFKVQEANIVTSQVIRARAIRKTAEDRIEVAISTTAGRTWEKVYEAHATGSFPSNGRS
ncbi:hypothetical protein, partial [Thermogutta sp.]|uniref:hypothetical protein n=1 Tax=Thermogutta sp. TaxID=1962930 RepID=UPI003C7D100C